MTEKQLREKVVKWVEKYLGAVAGSAGHTSILKVLNDYKGFTRYKMTVKDAWCATTVSSAFIATGLTKIFPCVECSCSAMINLAKKAGIWVEKDAYIPKTGDVLMYDWDDKGVGDCTGAPEHTGIVVSVSNNTIKVIEGNMGVGKVGYRNVPINGRYIRGFITPKYSSVATKTSSSPNTSTKPTKQENKKTEKVKKNPKPTFKVGNIYTTQVELRVRTGAGVKYKAKTHSQLTEDGKKNDKNKNGALDKGTKVTCLEVKKVGDNIWLRIPSGWIAGYYNNSVYVK